MRVRKQICNRRPLCLGLGICRWLRLCGGFRARRLSGLGCVFFGKGKGSALGLLLVGFSALPLFGLFGAIDCAKAGYRSVLELLAQRVNIF